MSQIKVYAYIRKSTPQNKDGESSRQKSSISYQKSEVQRIAKKENLQIVKTFIDHKTAYQAYIRDGFNEMMSLFEEGGKKSEIKGIVCSEQNRLARNYADSGILLWYMQSGLIDRVFTHDAVFTDSANDQMVLAIHFAMSKHSSDETSYRSKRAWKDKALIHGNHPNLRLIGYKYVGPKGHKLWKKDPKTAPLIVKIFKQYATGQYSTKEIAEYATSLGIRNPKTKRPYGDKIVRGWLQRIEYTGTFYYEGEEMKGSYSSLISLELFEQVAEILESGSRPKSKGRIDYAYAKKLIKCTHCGQYMSGSFNKGIIYYRCLYREEPCKSDVKNRPSYLKESEMDGVISDTLKLMEISKKKSKDVSKLADELFEKDSARYEAELRKLRAEMRGEEEDFKDFSREKVRLNKVPMKSRNEDWSLEFNGLGELMKGSKLSIDRFRRTIDKVEELKEELPQVVKDFIGELVLVGARFSSATPANRREITEVFCSNLTWDGRILRCDWNKAYLILVESKDKGAWLRGKGSNLQPID